VTLYVNFLSILNMLTNLDKTFSSKSKIIDVDYEILIVNSE